MSWELIVLILNIAPSIPCPMSWKLIKMLTFITTSPPPLLIIPAAASSFLRIDHPDSGETGSRIVYRALPHPTQAATQISDSSLPFRYQIPPTGSHIETHFFSRFAPITSYHIFSHHIAQANPAQIYQIVPTATEVLLTSCHIVY